MRLQFLISVLLFIATHAFGQQSEVRNFIGASLDSRLDPAKHQISHEYGNFSTRDWAIRMSSYMGRKVTKRLDLGISFDLNSRFLFYSYGHIQEDKLSNLEDGIFLINPIYFIGNNIREFTFPFPLYFYQEYTKNSKYFNLILAPLIRYNFIKDRRLGLDLMVVYGISQSLNFTKAYRMRMSDSGEDEIYFEKFKSNRIGFRNGVGKASLGLTYNLKNDWRLRIQKDLLHFSKIWGLDYQRLRSNNLVLEYQF